MDTKIKARLGWIKLYLEKQDFGYVCRHCGISRPTLRKWYRRYNAKGIEGLSDISKKPHNSPNKKLREQLIEKILTLRNERNIGARRIQLELFIQDGTLLSLASIHKALKWSNAKPIKKLKRDKKFKRYQRPVPGDRVQIDTCKIASGIYQYTAVDDCSRWRVMELYKRRSATNTLDFIDVMIEQFPFPVQRIQCDRGREFFAVKVQEKLMKYSIKFRPVKPGSPHLNGKVERSQQTDLREFYANTDLSNFETLKNQLKEWQFSYNYQRLHGSLNGKTPAQYSGELGDKTPLWEDVIAAYDLSKEHIQEQNYKIELALRKLKPCL